MLLLGFSFIRFVLFFFLSHPFFLLNKCLKRANKQTKKVTVTQKSCTNFVAFFCFISCLFFCIFIQFLFRSAQFCSAFVFRVSFPFFSLYLSLSVLGLIPLVSSCVWVCVCKYLLCTWIVMRGEAFVPGNSLSFALKYLLNPSLSNNLMLFISLGLLLGPSLPILNIRASQSRRCCLLGSLEISLKLLPFY